MVEKKVETSVNEQGVVTGQDTKVPTAVDMAGDSGQRVEDGTKEGGIITKDLVNGKKAADKANKDLNVPGY